MASVVMKDDAINSATDTGDISTATSFTARSKDIEKIQLKRKSAEKLKKIDLSQNKLTLCAKFLERCPAITQLNLSHNQLTKTKVFSQLQHLTVLNLSYNQISSLTYISQLKNLKALIIKGNKITTVPKLEMPYLNTLILAENSIEEIDVSGLPELDRLSLSHNKLSKFPQISANIWLKSVVLSHNAITKIPASHVSAKQIKFDILELGFNNISKLKSLASLGCLTLKRLTLFGNPVCEKEDYAVKVRIICPTLLTLDNKPITSSSKPPPQLGQNTTTQGNGNVTKSASPSKTNLVPTVTPTPTGTTSASTQPDRTGESVMQEGKKSGQKRKKKLTPQEERKLSGVVGIKILKADVVADKRKKHRVSKPPDLVSNSSHAIGDDKGSTW